MKSFRLLLLLLLIGAYHSDIAQSCDFQVASNFYSVCPSNQNQVVITASGMNTYTWYPSGSNSNPLYVYPGSTTIYTVVGSNGTCTSTQTIQIFVYPSVIATIQYSNTVFGFPPNSTLTIPVTQTGPSNGIYSALPSGLSINASTGLITASLSSYGTYTVSYTIPETDWCTSGYVANTVITLTNSECPFVIPKGQYELCPGDKVVFDVSGGYGSYYWSPASPNPTAGLNCTVCPSPTLTFSGGEITYMVYSIKEGIECGAGYIIVVERDDCLDEEIIGCCFSNYGAAVYISNQNTYLNIYCNLVNELGYEPLEVLSPYQKGEFQNVTGGTVRVKLDWIHNAKNDLYTVAQGTTILFGDDQKIKGNTSTHFNMLRLEGSGTKTTYIDEYLNSDLDLTNVRMYIQNHTFYTKGITSVVYRTHGYVQNDLHGYFSRKLGSATQYYAQNYLYPLGSIATQNQAFRYRPSVVSNLNLSIQDEVSVSFINAPPSIILDNSYVNANPLLTNVITNLSPSVAEVNKKYYHKIKNTVPPIQTSYLRLKIYFEQNDGPFQSISEWEKDPAQLLDWWGTTPGSQLNATASNDPGTLNLINAQTTGTFSFDHIPFALARSGFYINTNSFGSGGGNSIGTVFSLSATPIGANTPTGGGLNSPFGTGPFSGNMGGGGSTIFTPNPVSGEYVMSISPLNSCEVAGKIRFVIDQNGIIQPSDVLYGLVTSNTYLGELSEEVYNIDNQNTGITFSSTPQVLLKSCVNSITVCTSSGGDLIVNSGETLDFKLPSAGIGNTITYSQLKIYDKNSIIVQSLNSISPGINPLVTTSLSPGVYRFEMLVSASASPPLSETITGQFIVK